MANPDKFQIASLSQLTRRVQTLESRLDKIELLLKNLDPQEYRYSLRRYSQEDSLSDSEGGNHTKHETFQESSVFEYGFVWISSIVYLFGIIFLIEYTKDNGYNYFSSLTGYVAVIAPFFFSFLLRKSFPHLLFPLQITGLLLLYYVTLRLHFFTPEPLVSSNVIALCLLLITVIIQFIYGIKRENEFLAVIAVALMLGTALFYNNTHVTLPLIAVSALISLYCFYRYGWWRLTMIILFLVYLSHLLWLLNNPLLGNQVKAVELSQGNIYYLFLYAVTFVSTLVVRHRKLVSETTLIAIAVGNVLCFSFVLWLDTLIFYLNNFTWIYLLVTVACLLFAIWLKANSNYKFFPAFYGCVGFLALSVAVYGFAGFPQAYFYLALQSLLVVSLALWFQSRLIVLVNTILYSILFIVYLFAHTSAGYVIFTFGIVALATARVLNWKKERLTLKTDMLRNIYLITAFFTILYGLNQTISEQYITLAWTGAAVLYFILSIVLKNKKYRWMSVITILVSCIRLFIIDLSRLEVGYRVVAFLLFAVIALSVSLFYTKKIKGKI